MRNVKCKKFKGKGRKGIRERGREGERGKQRRKKRRRRQRRERDRWGGNDINTAFVCELLGVKFLKFKVLMHFCVL